MRKRKARKSDRATPKNLLRAMLQARLDGDPLTGRAAQRALQEQYGIVVGQRRKTG